MGLRVAQVMEKPAIAVHEGDTLERVARTMLEQRVASFRAPVCRRRSIIATLASTEPRTGNGRGAAVPPQRPRAISLQPWLAHLVAHIPIARCGEDPEGVHQVRVACARLRTWLKLGGRRVLRDDLSWLRARAARQRDLDVLRAREPSAFADPRLQERWAPAHRELLQALDDPRTERLILALSVMPAVPRKDAEKAARRLAGIALRRGRKATSRRKDVAALHGLRCALRALRYALEWMGRKSGRIAGLQETIGGVCDRAVALRQLRIVSGHGVTTEQRRSRIEEEQREGTTHALRAWKRVKPVVETLA